MRKLFVRPLLAAVLSTTLVYGPVSPAFAQEQTQNPTPAATPVSPTSPAQGTTSTSASSQAPNVALGLSRHDFTHGPSWFPNIVKPYKSIELEHPDLANSPRLEDLIHDGKLELTLNEAVELAMQNNLDIQVQRYNPWLAQTDILRALGGGAIRGLGSTIATVNSIGSSTQGLSTSTTGAGTANTTGIFASGAGSAFPLGASPQPYAFDPTLSASVGFQNNVYPVNNPFISGIGTSGPQAITSGPVYAFPLVSHNSTYNASYTQGFWTGTSLAVQWTNTRSSTNIAENLFNPYVQTSAYVTITQQLLNGFGLLPNTRNIVIAKNNKKIADLQFELQVITTVTSTVNAYWELVYARDNVKVQEQAVAVSEKLYNDNKKQLEIGTMAPLDVTQAESQAATDRQNMILAQTTQLQQEQILKASISKNPLDPRLVNVEIIPIDTPTTPPMDEAATFDDAVKEAFQKRPDLRQQEINLETAKINVKVTRNGLLPVANVQGIFGTSGLSGNALANGNPTVSAGEPVVDAGGAPVLVNTPTGTVPVFVPNVAVPQTCCIVGGVGDAYSQLFNNRYPNYQVAFNLTVPIRNRQAQADNQAAILQERQAEAQQQQIRNSALLDVRNTYIALQQNRARVEAAGKARQLQQQTFDAEQKKYSLGASTVYNVILTQRDLVKARADEIRALADLQEAKANYERALGRTLEVHHITVAADKPGRIEHENLIPGTPEQRAIASQDPNELLKQIPAGYR